MPARPLLAVALALACPLLFLGSRARAEEIRRDVPYRAAATRPVDGDPAACTLDVHLPTTRPVRATLVWFHGGGLSSGDKREADAMATLLADEGVALLSANYRLAPAVKNPVYIDDAAAAVAWAFVHAGEFGGDPKAIYVGGYSAGGFLSMLLATDASRLAPFGVSPAQLAGVVTVSGQTSTHFQILTERGIPNPKETCIVDDDAPLRHASAAMPRVLSFIGDDDWPARADELAYFFALLRVKKHPDARLVRIAARDHGSIWQKAVEPGDLLRTELLKFLLPATRPTTQP